MSDQERDIFLFAERTALLLGCLRNYNEVRDPQDLEGALRLEPLVAVLLARVRERLPRAG